LKDRTWTFVKENPNGCMMGKSKQMRVWISLSNESMTADISVLI